MQKVPEGRVLHASKFGSATNETPSFFHVLNTRLGGMLDELDKSMVMAFPALVWIGSLKTTCATSLVLSVPLVSVTLQITGPAPSWHCLPLKSFAPFSPDNETNGRHDVSGKAFKGSNMPFDASTVSFR